MKAKATEKLWKQCFNDTDEFIRMYFQMRYKDEINMPVYEKGQMIAALQMIPYPMTFCNQLIPTSYVSGACTHPEYRNRGIMGKLLSDTFRRMYKDGVWISTLIPAEEWLFNYYSRYGYVSVFDYALNQIDGSQLKQSPDYQITEYDPAQPDVSVYNYFSCRMRNRPCCIQHTPEDFEVILADLQLSGGKLLVCRFQKEIVGLAFCVPAQDCLYVTEMFYDNANVHDSLLKEASLRFNIPNIESITPPTDMGSRKLGMARIINAKKILQLYAQKHPDLCMTLRIFDPFIKANRGNYKLNNGICERISQRGTEHISLDIEKLARMVLLEDHPYMSLMLN